MTPRTVSKLLLLLAISLGVPSVTRPALAGVRAAQGRRHHRRHHERQREHQQRERERERAHGGDGERHGEL